MKIAVMQPYFFPYIGYWQLMASVDRFVIFDDANYISRGWINRNRILLHGKPFLFTIPLSKSSQNRKINEIDMDENLRIMRKTLKTFETAYKKAPYYEETMPLVGGVLERKGNFSRILIDSINSINRHIGLKTEIFTSSTLRTDTWMDAQTKIVTQVKALNGTEYHNPIGGTHLYDKAFFAQHNLILRFVRPDLRLYRQFENPFIPGLSLIDVLMFNGAEKTGRMVQRYSYE